MWCRNDEGKGVAGRRRVEMATGVTAAPQSRLGMSGIHMK